MRESTGSRLADPAARVDAAPRTAPLAIPAPRPVGVCALFTAIAACTAGALRHELLLTLLGALLLAVSAYCFIAALLLSLSHRKRAGALSARIVPAELSAGQPGTVICSRNNAAGGRFLRLPGILIRYQMELHTGDGRRLTYIFDPDRLEDTPGSIPGPERGAYYGDADRFLILDLLGLFQAAFKVPQHRGERLLALPGAAEKPLSLVPRFGGHEHRTAPRFQRTDDLIDHRPYVPGDDPRRINWKLYSHAGDLFIREGEPEPPPHSRLVILLDSQTDPLLYTAETGRRGVDLLCEQSLALVQEYSGRGLDVLIGYAGGEIQGGDPKELAAVLARPWAIPLSGAADLPDPPDDRNILLLALPRSSGGEAALDRFLKKRGSKTEIDVLFLYSGEGLDEAAETSAIFYNKRGGVYARRVKV